MFGKAFNFILFYIFSLVLTACGGGGYSFDPPTTTTTYYSNNYCWNGVPVESQVSLAEANSRFPAGCAPSTSTPIIQTGADGITRLVGIQNGATLAQSTGGTATSGTTSVPINYNQGGIVSPSGVVPDSITTMAYTMRVVYTNAPEQNITGNFTLPVYYSTKTCWDGVKVTARTQAQADANFPANCKELTTKPTIVVQNSTPKVVLLGSVPAGATLAPAPVVNGSQASGLLTNGNVPISYDQYGIIHTHSTLPAGVTAFSYVLDVYYSNAPSQRINGNFTL